MALDQKAIIKQIEDVLAKSNLGTSRHEDFSDLSAEKRSEAISLLYSAIDRLAPAGSRYVQNAKLYENLLKGNLGLAISPLRGILKALRTDYESGYLQSVVELVHADIFADFLEMAEYLLQQGYKDPAAVITGSVLEAHLRKLCDKHQIPVLKADGTNKKAESLNTELTPAQAYNMLDQKSVTAWLDLRNKAAHGKYGEYTKDQVASTLENVRNFILRIPA
jgi:hypothetical protein